MSEPLSEPLVAGLRERLLLLRGVNTFGRLSDQAMLLLAEQARARSYAVGERALEEGRIDHVHVVGSGRFEVTRGGKPVSTVGAGGVIGVVSFLCGDTYGVTATATEPARTLELPMELMTDVFEESYTFLRAALRIGANQLSSRVGHYNLASGEVATSSPRPVSSIVERAVELAEHGLFATWNANAIYEIAQSARVVELAKDAALFEVGDRPASAFHVVHGRLACREECRMDGGPGAMYGMLEMLGGFAAPHTAIAVEPTTLIEIRLDELLAALDTHRDLALSVLARISKPLLPPAPR